MYELLKEIADFLPLIAALIMMVGAWYVFKVKSEMVQTNHQGEIISLKASNEGNRKDIADIKDRVGNIETSLGFIKDEMKEIKHIVLHALGIKQD